MNIREAIRNRRSIRTFDQTALSPEDAQKILKFAEMVENPYDIHISWYLLDGREKPLKAPVISGAVTYIAGKMPRVAHAEEAFGYTFEKIVLYAETLGIGTTWIAGTMNRSVFEKAVSLQEGEVMPCVSPLGYPAKKMSLRETLMRKGVKADSRKPFEELFFDGSFHTPLSLESAGNLRDALEAIRLAPSAVNKQPWRILCTQNAIHFFEIPSKGYSDSSGWDLQKIDMGIALCHFSVVAADCGIRHTFSVERPEISIPDGMVYIASYRF